MNVNKQLSIVPGGCLQFVDLAFTLDRDTRFTLYFREDLAEGEQEPDSPLSGNLVVLEDREDGIVERDSGQAGQWQYEVDSRSALRTFSGQWMPVPILRTLGNSWDDGEPRFDGGPSNWARVHVNQDEQDGEDNLFRCVLALDTNLEPKNQAARSFAAPSQEEVEAEAEFRLAWRERDNVWFLTEGWLNEWVRIAYENPSHASRRRRHEDEDGFATEYLAHYLCFLQLLARAGLSRPLRLVNPASGPHIQVDLVLDVGNARTSAVLVESRPQRPTTLGDSYPVEVRDLTVPHRKCHEPFGTALQFAEADFGNRRLSARSSRLTDAFVWPTAVRVGPEAARLARRAVGAEGPTGLSSPKRYLWDQRERLQQWRLNGRAPDGRLEPPATRGSFAQHLNMAGTPVELMDQREVTRDPILRGQSQDRAFEARYTRSSLMMFVLAEIIAQALVTMNSPQGREQRPDGALPRRLRQVILTLPTAMPLAEQKIYRRWARWAVWMVWKSLGWDQWYSDDQRRGRPSQSGDDHRASPEVRCQWDEATCTQLVYLFNELREKFDQDATTFMRLVGKPRGEERQPSLRVASMDIGGGTTDLSIVTYSDLGGSSHTVRLAPSLEFREGFNIAGDDILCAIIEDHLMQDLTRALGQAGVGNPRFLLGDLFGRELAGKTLEQRTLQAQFTAQVAVPLGLAMLAHYERGDPKEPQEVFSRPLADFFAPNALPKEEVASFVNQRAAAAGGADFDLLQAPLTVDPRLIDKTVRRVLGQVIDDLCEVVYLYDCDVLLLTGRPSKWPGVMSSVLGKAPLPPDRILPMHSFRVGTWYPFTDPLGNIKDPKSTVVVGAMLRALAEGSLEGFSFDNDGIQLSPTARYIGEMSGSGQITDDKVWFEVNPDDLAGQELEREVLFTAPTAIGFRQLPLRRWTTTRFYFLDFAGQQARQRARGRLPYRVNLIYTLEEVWDEANQTGRDEGQLTVDSVVDAQGDTVSARDLDLRLQTMPWDEGYWLDTGVYQNL